MFKKQDIRKFKFEIRKKLTQRAIPNFMHNPMYWKYNVPLTNDMIKLIEVYKSKIGVRDKNRKYIEYNLRVVKIFESFKERMIDQHVKMNTSLLENEFLQKHEFLRMICGELHEKFLPKNYYMLKKIWETHQD